MCYKYELFLQLLRDRTAIFFIRRRDKEARNAGSQEYLERPTMGVYLIKLFKAFKTRVIPSILVPSFCQNKTDKLVNVAIFAELV